MNFKIIIFGAFLITFVHLQNSAQQIFLKGTVKDSISHSPLIGATVQLKNLNTEKISGSITDVTGSFEFSRLRSGAIYEITINYLGYSTFKRKIKLQDSGSNLGDIYLSEAINKIKEIEITGQAKRAEQIEDTLQLNADAYKVNPDASAEDLVKKMPGITVENGQVKAQGEDVQRVYVDGRPFFDQDPTLTLRNLPAEVVSKIQVFDEQSEQARFTGFNDGQTTKTINVITRSNMRNGQFGKIYGGYGSDNKYYAGGNINIFKGNSRISLIGLSNNINQQNFSSQDLLGLTTSGARAGRGGFRGGMPGGGGMRPGGGAPAGRPGMGEISNFLVGQQAGIATTHALGVNYSDKWGSKINITGSYFINNAENVKEEITSQEIFATNYLYNEESRSNASNLNHRINLRFEYTIDSLNSLMIRPSLNIQENRSNSATLARNLEENIPVSQSDNRSNSNLNALNFSNDILYMHRFLKSGRTISLNVNTGINTRDGHNSRFMEDIYNMDAIAEFDTLDQYTTLPTNGYNLSSRIAYTEPVGKFSQLQVNYRISGSWNDSDRETFDFNNITGKYDQIDSLQSNIFKSLYITHQFGPGFRYRKEKIMFTAGINYEYALLKNHQHFPASDRLSQSFISFQPSAMLMYNISQTKNLRLFYRTNSNSPSIDQLQNVLDNSESLQVSIGNPDLKQSFQNNLFLRYSSTNSKKTSVFFGMLGFSNVNNYISNENYYTNTDTVFLGFIPVKKGTQFSRPVNLDGYWNLRFFTTIGFPVQQIKSNINVNTSYVYTRTPGLINGIKTYSGNNAYGLGLVISSNISTSVDFTLSSNSSYNDARSTSDASDDNNYFSQFTNFSLNLIFFKTLTFQSELGQQFYKGLSGDYDVNYVLWNVGIGKKLFKNNRGEIKLSVFDILNQNNNVSRNVTELYVEDTRSNVLQRYAMLTFTYNLRNFRMNEDINRPEEERRPPPGDMFFRPF
ncbi:MAG: TonB-dependent receptor [Bacteroidales bacterium]|nr:TonB-dependent receptor [Bacteroidales bacterium]